MHKNFLLKSQAKNVEINGLSKNSQVVFKLVGLFISKIWAMISPPKRDSSCYGNYYYFY